MARVLYADGHKNTKDLAERLKKEGIEAECIDDCPATKDKMGLRALDIFMEKYYGRISEYDVLIAHLGVDFNGDAKTLIAQYPSLHIVLVSQIPEDYSESEGRLFVCGYNSDKLIPFVRKALKK